MKQNIFVSYNPGVEKEQSLALRLQTISSLYSAKIHLPDRSGSEKLSENTKQRIKDSTFFVLFLVSEIKKEVESEIKFASKLEKKVIIFLDTENECKNSIINENQYVTLIPFSHKNASTSDILKKLMKHNIFKSTSQNKNEISTSNKKKKSDSGGILLAIIAIGIGLFLLALLLNDDDDE